MKKYYIIVYLIIIIIAFILIGKNVIPTKVDIEYLEVVEIIGMDATKDTVNVSVLLPKEAGGDKNEGNSAGSGGKALTVSSTTYSQAIDIIRAITEKYIIINHVKYYIVGEETAKNNLQPIVDYLARTDEASVKAKVLVSEGMTAEAFLNEVNNSGIDIVKTLQEASLDVNAKNFTTETTIIDLVDSFLQDKIVGVIPYVSEFTGDINQFNINLTEAKQGEENAKDSQPEQSQGGNESKSENQTKIFGFMTIGIIQDMKVVDKISLKEVEAYNMVMGNVDNIVVLIRPSDTEKIVVTCDTKEQSVKFKTKDNTIQEMIINLTYECDLDEVQSNHKLLTIERFEEFQTMIEQSVENEVRNILNKSFEMGIDFMKLGNLFEIKHPYIYMKIKDGFLQKLKQAKISVNIDCTINNTFDVMETNKYQKGDG